MSGGVAWRLFGLLGLAIAAGAFWFSVLLPLEAMRAHEPHVRYSLAAFVFVGFASTFGLFFVLFGSAIPYRDADRGRPTAAGWALAIVSTVLTGALYWWAKTQFEDLGYAYSGADHRPEQEIIRSFPGRPAPMAPPPTFDLPKAPGSS